jgi:hypothetical protein
MLVVVALAAVVLLVTAPFRAGRTVETRESAEIAELERAKERKYGEIREAELDYRTGKLSEDDFRALDRSLRAEAIELLHRLDRARGEGPHAD